MLDSYTTIQNVFSVTMNRIERIENRLKIPASYRLNRMQQEWVLAGKFNFLHVLPFSRGARFGHRPSAGYIDFNGILRGAITITSNAVAVRR